MEQSVDRISQLPEAVVQHILSFLPTKQVVQSTLFSKTWKHVWTTFPILGFHKTFFESQSLYSKNKRKDRDVQKKKTDFHKFVERNLRSRSRKRLRIKKFSLSDCLVKPKSMSRVDRWVSFVVESDAEVLNLSFGWSDIYYRLPQTVLVAKSLTELTLHQCKLKSTCGDIISLSSLKKLFLFNVEADDLIIQNLLVGCPVIENMTFDFCFGIKSLKFLGLPKVMTIMVQSNVGLERLELETPNLYSLYINQKHLLSELNLLPCKNLRTLYLNTWNITQKWFDDHLSELPLLENFVLSSCYMLERIKISSHHLKSLELQLCNEVVEVMIDAPKLCRLSYTGNAAISFSLNAFALLEAEYSMFGPYGWDDETIAFLSKMRNSKVFNLRIHSTKNVIIPKELRETLPSPLYNVKHLKLSIPLSFTRYEISELLDGLLWISPLPDILSMECCDKSKPDFDKITFEFSYGKPIHKRENPSCCKLLSFPCWRHCLKTVKIVNLRGFADREILNNYFVENAKTLENFQFHVGGIA